MAEAGVNLIIILLITLKVFGDTAVEDDINGGWKPASVEDSMKYYSSICTIPKINVKDMTRERFEKSFKDKPFILTFTNGATDWVKTEYWTIKNLSLAYEGWKFTAGKSIDIVYNGGKGDFNRTFKEYISEMRSKDVPGGDLTYLFDRFFYYNSSLPATVTVPEFLFQEGDPILFVGPSGTGATWHKHMPAWNGVVFGQKRWFVYPVEKTPPGGLYSYTPVAWLNYVYPKLKPSERPLECIQNNGEIFYVPESYYHAILNIGETVAISIQSKNVTTHTESEFYSAMGDHYSASTVEDESKARGYYDAAIRKYTDLHFLYPENTEVLAHISEIACGRGYQKRCERVLDLIVQQDPFAIDSIKLRSRIYYDRNDHEKCEKELLRAMDIHPLSKALLREHANLLWNIRKSESKKAYEKLLSVMDPDTQEAKETKEIIRITDFGPEAMQTEVTDETEAVLLALSESDTDIEPDMAEPQILPREIKEEL